MALKAGATNLVGHGGPIKAVATNAARTRALTGSFDYAMMLWDISGKRPRLLHRFDAHEGAVNAVAFAPDGRAVLAAGDDGKLWLWDARTFKLRHAFTGHAAKVNALSLSADGKRAVTASWDGTARLWDLVNLRAGPVLRGHRGTVNAVAFSKDGAFVMTAGSDGEVKRWRASDGAAQAPLMRNGWGVNVLARLPGSDRLVWGGVNGASGIIDGATGQALQTWETVKRPVLAAAVIAKPGLIAIGAGDGSIRIRRADDGALLEHYINPVGPIWALAFAKGGRALYFGSLDDFATRWQVAPRKSFEPVSGQFPRRFQKRESADLGARQFARKCSVCHTLKADGRNRAGPTLYRIFGRKAGTLPGYPYSPALLNADIVWSADTIGKLFALGPDHYTPGSKMPLQKISDKAQRDALIAYLKRVSGPPVKNGR